MPSDAAARFPESSFTPVAAAAAAVASRVTTPIAIVAVASAAKRPRITRARDCGVAIGLGTDLLGPEQNRRGLELVLRAALGSQMEAIVSATGVNAGIVRRPDVSDQKQWHTFGRDAR